MKGQMHPDGSQVRSVSAPVFTQLAKTPLLPGNVHIWFEVNYNPCSYVAFNDMGVQVTVTL